MQTQSSGRPFTDSVNELRDRRGLRFADLARGSGDARSSAWFNKLCNASDPWEVGPPGKDVIPGLAVLLNTTQKQLRVMIASEWYGVTADVAPQGSRDPLVSAMQALPDEDREIVAQMVHRLTRR